ncbi:methyltransferase-like protein 7A isoform X3 [Mangifera indica]|uniref:methyltransferase-like protein 7A isoform X3 n=1 Tax=Mangifera indica TaxID=29780 RepID=UPI001CFB3BF2|nr:methyltransferase-like protein 7A isoform X3 [Mangifera indica]
MIIPSYSLPSSFFINIKVTCSSQKTKLPIARERLTLCSCGRRHFIEAATTTALLPLKPSSSSELLSDYTYMLKRVHPPRPNWYEEFYASVMNSSMDSYEAEIAVYKSQIFGNLRGNAEKVLEIGIGTGPNLKYYANDPNIQVFGVDPNIKMEKYAQAAAVATGLPLTNFKFLQAVGEAIPLRDESVDAVVGTLVLCSVKDVGMTLQDGTLLKFWQSVLDPIQQIVADGCHLTRESGKDISEAGFSGLEVGNVYLSNASLINPHVYGIACK